jgi:hypothetical protein
MLSVCIDNDAEKGSGYRANNGSTGKLKIATRFKESAVFVMGYF